MVYLLCFDKKFKHAKHYIGYSENQDTFEQRLKYHVKGRGSKLMDAITKAGIGFKVARTWDDGDRKFERKLKNRKKSAELCPLCKDAAKERRRRLKVLRTEKALIAELNAPSPMFPEIGRYAMPVCPVVKTAYQYPIVNEKFEQVAQGLMHIDVNTKTIMQEYKENPKLDTTPSPDLVETLAKAKEIYVQSTINTSRWERIRSSLARFWKLLTA